MSEEKPLTGLKKRQQITDTRKQVFIMVAAAAAAVVVCVMVGYNLFQRIQYQNKVNSELEKTAKTMDNNVDSVDSLISNINALKTDTNLTLPNLKSDNRSVFNVIIDALPTEDDSVALSSSLQHKILSRSGASIEQISVDSTSSSSTATTTTTTTSGSASFPTAQAISFRVSFSGSYATVVSTLEDIEKTIRPISINSMTVEGSDDDLTVSINATTYYSSSVSFSLGEETIEYEEE